MAIVYQVLHHFREPVFRALAARNGPEVEYTFVSDPVNRLDSNRTIDADKAGRRIEEGGLPWVFVRNRGLPGGFLWQSGVVALAASSRFDTLILLGNAYYLSSWIAAIVGRLLGRRVLMWGHGLTRRETGPKWWFRRAFYRLAHGHLLYGERARGLMHDGGLDRSRSVVVFNSLDYAAQVRIREALRPEEIEAKKAKLFDDPSLPVLVCIGRIDARKRLDLLLSASDELARRGCPVNVLLIGEGEGLEALERQRAGLDHPGRVVFYGASFDEAEIGLLMKMSSICVCPGHTGLTAIHAMAYGVPVVTHGDLQAHAPEAEAITSGETGDFFEAGDEASLAAAVERVLAVVESSEELAARCIERVEQSYTPERQADLITGCVLGSRETDGE